MVQVVTGDSQEEVIIFRYRHTNRHCIIIYISSSSSLPKSRGGKEEAVVDERDEGDHTKDEQPEPQEHVDFLQKKHT